MSKMNKVINIYKKLSSTQSLVEAKVLPGGIINSTWTQRNIESGKNIKYLKTHVVNNTFIKLSETVPCDISAELLHSVSPTAKKRAVLREVGEKKSRKQYLEIWNNNNLTNCVDLYALNKHGDVYINGEFKSFAWSPDETKLMYIAERKLQKLEPFYKREPEKPDTSEPAVKGEEYVYRQDWGEQLVAKHMSVIAVYDTEKDSVKILEGLPSDICPAQLIWYPDGNSLIGVALCTMPRKLGLVYCSNRPSYIFKLDFFGNFTSLSTFDKSVTSPKITPDGKYLLWLERNSGGPHQGAFALMRIDLTEEQQHEPYTIIDVVENSIKTENGQEFYGLFVPVIPRRCWALDERRLVFSVPKISTIQTYTVDIENGAIIELINNEEGSSQIILDVFNDILLVTRKNYLHPDKLVTTNLPEKGEELDIHWKEITETENIELLNHATSKHIELEHNNNDSVKKFSAIYFGPKTGEDKQVPLIVWPHGGPHSVLCSTFALEPAVLVAMGFGIIFVNYRGSIGAGEQTVQFLLGRIGDADVKDCVLAGEKACEMFPWLDPKRKSLVGGSHGGFLVHHLSGQFPTMFKAVVSRNPVIDVSVMSVISDIPDWSAAEVGATYTQEGPVDDELFMKMRKISPIQHAHKIEAPTYLMLGTKDLRVPCHQGLELYHKLKAQSIPVKLCIYEDNHSLTGVPNEMDHVINGALWLLEYAS